MKIIPPTGTYFIHGLSHWSKNFTIGFIHDEICVSIQKDGYTSPLRSVGFVLEIEQDGILAAFDKDATSKIILGKRTSVYSHLRTYQVCQLDILIKNTPKNKHNELWVVASKATIIEGYVVGNNNAFEKAMKKSGYKIRKISQQESLC